MSSIASTKLAGIGVGVVGIMVGAMVGGFKTVGLEETTKPNQGITASGANVYKIHKVGIVVSLVSLLITVPLSLYVAHLNIITPIIESLLVLAISGFIAERKGGGTVIRHATLRWLHYRSGRSPKNYADFLDFCVDHTLLRKVGGAYIFRHRLLLEHFAAKYIPERRGK